MATNRPEPRQRGGDVFLREIDKVDPSKNRKAELLIDSNVVIEFMSFGDLFKEWDKHRNVLELMLFGRHRYDELAGSQSAEAAWRSPSHRYRQLRARASIVLMWVLAETGKIAAMLGKEVMDILDKTSPAPVPQANSLLADGDSYALTTVVVHAIHEMLMRRGLQLGPLTDVNHLARGNSADAELLRLAEEDNLTIISNEGYTIQGLSDYKANGSKSLRGLGRDRGIVVLTPGEYLKRQRVDMRKESQCFLKACEADVITQYLPTLGSWLLELLDQILGRSRESRGYAAALEQVIPLYRLILLDERDQSLRGIPPPQVPIVRISTPC